MGWPGVIDRTEDPRSSAVIMPLAVAPSSFDLKSTPPATDQERWRRFFPSEGLGGVAKRMPGRSVGEPMNSMPAASRCISHVPSQNQ
jgi:hypothetical protein